MAEQTTGPPTLPRREGREGNRWVNHRPNGEEIAEWFKTIALHAGMLHADYVSGITLIQATEKSDEIVGFTEDNRPQILKEVQHVFYIPYPKVETRISYFHDYTEENNWVGILEPVPAPDSSGLPVGFNVIRTSLPDGKVVSAVCCTTRARILEKRDLHYVTRKDPDGRKRRYLEGTVVHEGAPGTKSVPLVDRWGGFDENAVAKAQTGSVGRALGMIDMLVIPGTGVATAEDMQEALSAGRVPGSPQAVALQDPTPAPEGDQDDVLRAHALTIIQRLDADFPEALTAFREWAASRQFRSLREVSGLPLKGIVKKLEAILDEAAQGERPVPADVAADVDLSGDG